MTDAFIRKFFLILMHTIKISILKYAFNVNDKQFIPVKAFHPDFPCEKHIVCFTHVLESGTL